MGSKGHGSEDKDPRAPESHERFLELAAVSTSGELNEEERRELDVHLAGCSACRDVLQEFEATVGVGVPLLHEHLSGSDFKVYPGTLPREVPKQSDSLPRHGRRLSLVNWKYVWMPFAAAVILAVVTSFYFFEVGQRKGVQLITRNLDSMSDPKLEGLEQQISDAGRERELYRAQLADRDRAITAMRRRFEEQSKALQKAKAALANLQQTAEGDEKEKETLAAERAALAEQLAAAQAALEKTQSQIASRGQQQRDQQSLAASLEAQIRDLHGQLRDREQELGRQQELLAHDRDIRELMGARDLYIAEVYDVGGDGQTRKPYGRVFYTKGKSLIFYAYDLDQQAGLKKATTFQAWGGRGQDRQQATNLGVFYEDSSDKKRWVLKFDDPKKLEQIDSVFVTVEPRGGSARPSGKPLLFAYLKVAPNHP